MNFEEEFKSWTLEQKVEWALGPNICNLSEHMRSIIVDLKAENEQLKKDLEHARSYKHTIKMRNRNLQTENERLKGENAMLNEEREKLKETIRQCDSFTLDSYKGLCKRLEKENAKLKCLSLHLMTMYFFVLRDDPYHGTEYYNLCLKYSEAYRKAKKALREGSNAK